MGQGLYGCNQGTENRGAARHAGVAIAEDLVLDNALCEGEILNGKGSTPGWIALWKLGAWQTLNTEIEKLRQNWDSQLLMPETKLGEDPRDFVNRVRKARNAWRARIQLKIQSLLAQATRGIIH